MRIAIIDYGFGNLRSVHQALRRVGAEGAEITADAKMIAKADRVVFPGQGAMPDCMREIKARGLHEAILTAAATKPFLGICIGLQMLFSHSDEGDVRGLQVFEGDVRRFSEHHHDEGGVPLKIPHMGWNTVKQVVHPLWAGIPDDSRFYFVHSYHVVPDDSALVAGITPYGAPFTSAVGKANMFAVQFHPEKSAHDGLKLLENFIHWSP